MNIVDYIDETIIRFSPNHIYIPLKTYDEFIKELESIQRIEDKQEIDGIHATERIEEIIYRGCHIIKTIRNDFIAGSIISFPENSFPQDNIIFFNKEV